MAAVVCNRPRTFVAIYLQSALSLEYPEMGYSVNYSILGYLSSANIQMTNQPWGSGQIAFQRTIRQVRKRAGLTQVQMAERLAKPQSYVSKYENGERRLDYLEVREICACCKITLAAFDRLLTQSVRAAGGK